MTNFDLIKDSIDNIRFGLIDGKVKPCNEVTNMFDGCNCHKCDFYRDPKSKDFIHCEDLRFEWMKQEVNEKVKDFPKLSQEEFNFLSLIEEGFIVRDEDNSLWLFVETPFRYYNHWEGEPGFYPIKNEYFKFITWDNEPILSTHLLSLGMKVESNG